MNWETLIAIVGAVGGATGLIELVKYFVTRKAHRREAESKADMVAVNVDSEEWRIWKDQLDRMNVQIETKDQRIEKLNSQLADKEIRFQEQIDKYIEQTKRLRECQDREYESQAEIRRLYLENQKLSEQIAVLTKEVGDLKLFIEEQQCRKLPCPFRRPQNRHTRKALAELCIEVDIDELPGEDPEPELIKTTINNNNK